MNAQISKEALIKDTRALREELAAAPQVAMYQAGLTTVLVRLEKLLTEGASDGEALAQCALSIFRIVTDDRDVERSAIGQKLLFLQQQVRFFTNNAF